jgi:WD40 repeat protein
LQQRPWELPGQLMARMSLGRFEGIQRMFGQARRLAGSALLPLRPSLIASGALVRTFAGHQAHIDCLALTPDGKLLVSGSNDNTVRVWNSTTGAELRTLWGHRKSVKAVAVTDDPQFVISGSFDRTIRIWDLTSSEPPRVIRTGGSSNFPRLIFEPAKFRGCGWESGGNPAAARRCTG